MKNSLQKASLGGVKILADNSINKARFFFTCSSHTLRKRARHRKP